MTRETLILDNKSCPLRYCPQCGVYPFKPKTRGQLQKLWIWPFKQLRELWSEWNGQRDLNCALVCSDCGLVVGWEASFDGEEIWQSRINAEEYYRIINLTLTNMGPIKLKKHYNQ